MLPNLEDGSSRMLMRATVALVIWHSCKVRLPECVLTRARLDWRRLELVARNGAGVVVGLAAARHSSRGTVDVAIRLHGAELIHCLLSVCHEELKLLLKLADLVLILLNHNLWRKLCVCVCVCR